VAAARDLPAAQTDAHRVEQILVNLLTNAIRHTPAASRVTISISVTDDEISIVVDDQGPGIAAADLERVFDIYETKAAEEGRGLGLGLPLSRRLARLLGGDLVAVYRPDSGGRLILSLPTGAPTGSS
jgi:signal transduction histidine kinase